MVKTRWRATRFALPDGGVYVVGVSSSSAKTSDKSSGKSASPVIGLVALWTIALFSASYFGRGLASGILPHVEEITWSTRFPISAQTTVTIRAWRHGKGDFSAKRPLNDCAIALNESHVMDIGPNVSICHYTNAAGQTIRGAAPPEADYLADWLKDAGEPPAVVTVAAPQIAAKAAELFDPQKLDAGVGPDWSMVRTDTVPQLSYVAAIIVLVIIWISGLCAIIFVASAKRRRQRFSQTSVP